jgi:hypothetical protein
MYLLWLRVAAILYAAASITIFPAVLYSDPARGVTRWRQWCVHLGGLAFFFHFVSVVEMLLQAHRWVPMGFREVESLLGFTVAALFFLVWWLYNAIPPWPLRAARHFLHGLCSGSRARSLCVSFGGCSYKLVDRAYRRPAARVCGPRLQPAGVRPLSHSRAPHQEQARLFAWHQEQTPGGPRSTGCRPSTHLSGSQSRCWSSVSRA